MALGLGLAAVRPAALARAALLPKLLPLWLPIRGQPQCPAPPPPTAPPPPGCAGRRVGGKEGLGRGEGGGSLAKPGPGQPSKGARLEEPMKRRPGLKARDGGAL